MREGSVGIGASQQHEDIGASGEGAPRLHAVDEPTSFGWCSRGHDAGHIRPEIGFGHRHGCEYFGRGQFGQPILFLRLSSAVDKGPCENLGTGDQRPADAERAPAQLLGRHDHAEVVAFPAGGEAPVLLGNRKSKPAQLGQATDDLFGDIAIGTMDVFGLRAHLVHREAVECLAHQLEVRPHMVRRRDVGQGGQHSGVSARPQERSRRSDPVGLRSPCRFSARDPAYEIGQDIGHKS